DTVSNLRSIYKQVVGASSIPFYGEPLKGLQVMGMLETRTLDFENIILLSVNDDIIPSGRSMNSFIPFDVKWEFKLPTYRDRNAIFAYHFYRLLQHGKRIFLLYNTESDSLGGGEKSRFITQLLHELPIYNPEIKITEKLFHLLPQKESRDFTITIEKDDQIIEMLLEKAEKGLSPSSLNVYRNCSLQFYFQYIARLRDIDEVEETIEAATLGTVVHEVMRELYYPYIDNVLTPEMVTKMISEVASITDKAFKQHYKGGDLQHGKNLLIVNVARRIITNYLKKEILFLESIGKKGNLLTIIHLEEPLDTIFSVDIGDSKIEVKIKGTTDRIDKQADVYRVIDYKTGSVKPGDLKIKEWESMESDPRSDKSFQVLTYAYLFLSQPGF
ncbi:MAG: PD-(D/E)XK nuclease family protein, partial [Bacteroidales bacterium]|nr:PD-(D/E)XK nuclease family protein [Bacteroidales bacterium]